MVNAILAQAGLTIFTWLSSDAPCNKSILHPSPTAWRDSQWQRSKAVTASPREAPLSILCRSAAYFLKKLFKQSTLKKLFKQSKGDSPATLPVGAFSAHGPDAERS